MRGGLFAFRRGTVRNTVRIAITGGIAEGKSTVVGMIAAMGFETASSDRMAREVFSDPETQRLLAAILGKDEERVSPAELRQAMSESDAIRAQVNRVMHPRIRSLMEASTAPFHEVPLLIEACLQGHYEEIWVVTCGAVEQRRRLIERLTDERAADALIASQLSSEVKLAFADAVIRSEVPIEDVRCTVCGLVEARRDRLPNPVDLR